MFALLGILNHMYVLPKLPTTSFSAAGSHSPGCCLVSFFPHGFYVILEERSYISYSFNSSTSHRARHKRHVKFMHISLLIYGPAWELRGFWMWLSGFASKINTSPPGFQLIALFQTFFPKGEIYSLPFNSLLIHIPSEKCCSVESWGEEMCLVAELVPTAWDLCHRQRHSTST